MIQYIILYFNISGITFFGKVTVDLSREVASDRCCSKEEATEAAYKVLWESFCISAPVEGKVQILSLKCNVKPNRIIFTNFYI